MPRENALNCSGGGGSELGSVLHGIAEFGEAQDNFDTFGSMCEAVYEGRVDEERDAWRGGSSSEYGSEYGSDSDEAAPETMMLPNTSSSDFGDFGGGGSSTSASSPERAFGGSDSDERAFSSDSDEPELTQVFWSESAGLVEFEDQEEPADQAQPALAAAAAAAATLGRLYAAGEAEMGEPAAEGAHGTARKAVCLRIFLATEPKIPVVVVSGGGGGVGGGGGGGGEWWWW